MKKGFLLIESLVYISCVTLLVLLFMACVATLYTKVKNQVQITKAYLNGMIALHTCVLSLKKASCNGAAWKERSKATLIFTGAKGDDYGWEFKGIKLRYVQGKYDSLSKRWYKHSNNLVLDAIKQGYFKLIESKKEVQGALIFFGMQRVDTRVCESFVCLMQGRRL